MIYCSTVLMIFSGLAVGAVPLLRWQEPNLSRPYRMPLYPFMAGFFALMSIVIVASAFYERPVEGGRGTRHRLSRNPAVPAVALA